MNLVSRLIYCHWIIILKKYKMKKLQKITGYLLATVILFLVSQFPVLAAGGTVNNDSSLSAFQVIGGLVVLLFFILVPLMRGAGRHITVDKK
jgi:hypothetical protein